MSPCDIKKYSDDLYINRGGGVSVGDNFSFEIKDIIFQTEDGLASVQLEFMLLDWDRVTKNEVSINLRKLC